MPSFVTLRDHSRRRGIAGVGNLSPANPRRAELPPANPRRMWGADASSGRVIHKLITGLGMPVPRYLTVTSVGGGWNPLGGGWKQAKNATPRHFDLINPQLNSNRRGLAGVGGGCFPVFTSEISDKAPQTAKRHVFANRPFPTPANPRQLRNPQFCSRHVTTKAGAR